MLRHSSVGFEYRSEAYPYQQHIPNHIGNPTSPWRMEMLGLYSSVWETYGTTSFVSMGVTGEEGSGRNSASAPDPIVMC